MMKLTGLDREFLDRVQHYVARVRAEVPSVRHYGFGRNLAGRGKGFDWVVVGVFDSSADHDAYQVAPVHIEMRDFMTPHIADMVVCDFADD